jgi:2-keto-4-pentenoate hydratase
VTKANTGLGAFGLAGSTPASIAESFVSARRAARAVDRFPGEVPASLAAAYAVQDAAIALSGDPIGGWKVGRIAPSLQAVVGADRLAGPIFAANIWRASDAPVRLPIILGGFAAAEAEIALEIGVDVPATARRWTLEDAAALVTSARSAIEFAGSPLATINDLGPHVVVSDFGNNAGMILGPELPNWRDSLPDLECVSEINGRTVGRAKVGALETGPLESVRFLLENLGARGIAAPAGTWVCSGAITGVHDLAPQDRAVCSFGDTIAIAAIAAPAAARART